MCLVWRIRRNELVVAEGCGENKEARRSAIEVVRCVVVLYKTWKGEGRVSTWTLAILVVV